MKATFVLLGAKTADIEKAREWIEDATGVEAQPFHNDYVGDYYRIGDFGPGEEIEICSGTSEDEDGNYPTEHEFPDWKVIVKLSKARGDSAYLRALERLPDRFEVLRKKTYEI